MTPVKNRANTPEEKAEVLRRIGECWERNPDLRLVQLLMAACVSVNYQGNPFYIEDFELVAGLNHRVLNGSDGTKDNSPNP